MIRRMSGGGVFFPGWEGMQPTSLVKIQGFGDVGLKGGSWQAKIQTPRKTTKT